MKFFFPPFSKLGRKTNTSLFIPELDGLRFLSIFLIVVLHCQTIMLKFFPQLQPVSASGKTVHYLVESGSVAVEIFFIISGFILGFPFVRQHILKGPKVTLSQFYMRRVTRLEPPYIISLLLFFVVLSLSVHSFSQYAPNLIASIFYSHFFVYGKWSAINPVTWTLETEVQFYMLAPVFALLLLVGNALVRRITLVGVMVLIVFLFEILNPFALRFHLERSIFCYAPFFLIGFLMADIYFTAHWYKKIRPSYLWDLAILPAFYLMYTNSYAIETPKRILLLLGVFLLFASAFKGIWVNKLFRNKYLVTLGGMCYSLYLFHYGLFYFIIPRLSFLTFSNHYLLSFTLLLLVGLLVLYVVGALFFYYIEKPCMDKNWPAKLKAHFRQRLKLTRKPAS